MVGHPEIADHPCLEVAPPRGGHALVDHAELHIIAVRTGQVQVNAEPGHGIVRRIHAVGPVADAAGPGERDLPVGIRLRGGLHHHLRGGHGISEIRQAGVPVLRAERLMHRLPHPVGIPDPCVPADRPHQRRRRWHAVGVRKPLRVEVIGHRRQVAAGQLAVIEQDFADVAFEPGAAQRGVLAHA